MTDMPADRAHVEWGYGEADGPHRWGELHLDYALCATGQSQSPIDIRSPREQSADPPDFDYHPTELRIVNNGHAIQIDCAHGGSVGVDGRRYRLRQFHFHSPAEHTIAGHVPAMEIHFVHEADDGELLVVGVLIEPGPEHASLDAIWEHLPAAPGAPVDVPLVTVFPEDFIPPQHTCFRYEGSLTTPPCTEGVRWLVMTEALGFSPEQIERFRAVMHGNVRPTQPLNGRVVMMDA